MVDDAPKWKQLRTELRKHLFHCHGETKASDQPHPMETVEEMEELHEALHLDGYACPPHSHAAVEPGAYALGEIELTYGESFLVDVRKAVKGIE